MAEFLNIELPRRQIKIYRPRRIHENNRHYRSLFRFNEENVQRLSEYFLEEYYEKRGGALDNETKMKIFLRCVGDPGFQVGIGEDIGIDQSTVSKTIYFVARRIVEKVNDWIHFPQTVEELNLAQINWQRRFRFPHAIGALDCTHIPILKPSVYGDEYVNRLGVASFNVQGTCNAFEYFTSVVCRWQGSVHDSRIWRNSEICRVMTENRSNALLLCDKGYGLSPWLMTPYRRPEPGFQRVFNRLLTRERAVIERVFGQLKSRFPILKNNIRLKTDRIPTIIVCCFILHNIAKELNDPIFDEINHEQIQNPVMGPEVIEHNAFVRRGINRRNQLANFIFENNLLQ